MGAMQAWEDFIQKQEKLLGKEAVEKWLRPLKIVHFDSGNLYLEAKDSFQVLWFEEHIRPQIKKELLNNNFRPVKVHITAAEQQSSAAKKFPKKGYDKTQPQIQFFFDKLDPSFTLENFIAGQANQIVFRLFCELCGFNPATEKLEGTTTTLAAFNPIYLWGASGSGKTHLLMALAHAFKSRGLNALYARAETFTEHVVAAIRGSEMQAFRKAYRNVDILLIDDVHVFARKNATQEEFFHTFNTLHTSGKQIILSSKCAPALLEEIEPRLVSRFEWGINVHFEKLGSADLIRVLEKRCQAFNFPLTEEVSGFLVESFPSSKSLQRALDAMVLRCHLEKDARYKRNSLLIDRDAAHRMLLDLLVQEEKIALSPEKIIAAVSSVYGIRKEDLLGKSQSQECSLPRQIAMFLCRHELKLAFQGIGQIFGRDHSTVMTSIKQIEKKIAAPEKELAASLAEIRTRFE
jgi:chromosomal replication initiator protein